MTEEAKRQIRQIFDDLEREEEALISVGRREPLRSEFVKTLFSSPGFISALNYAYRILVSNYAEHGIVVYKKVNSNSFKFVRRYGLPTASLEDLLIGHRKDPGAHVPMGDNLEEIVRHGIKPERFVRIGNFHTHPHSVNWFSPHDMEVYDGDAVGVEGAYAIFPCAHEMFEMLGSIPIGSKDKFELFGASMPIGGHKSNLYQGGFTSAEDMERIMRDCGFRTARVIIPVFNGKLVIGSREIDQLSKIGG